MNLLDPTTGEALSEDAIQRILFLANTVHVYQPPPLTSMKGHYAGTWTEDPQRHIFTARLRVFETSMPASAASAAAAAATPTSTSLAPRGPSLGADVPSPAAASESEEQDENDIIKIDLVLEDPSSGQLFAAAPYTSKADVEPVVDSTRFFALTVRDPSGRKAVLGIGFEERSEAFDLNLALQEANRSLGLDGPPHGAASAGSSSPSSSSSSASASASASLHSSGASASGSGKVPKDYSLKEGETITVNLGARGRRANANKDRDTDGEGKGKGKGKWDGGEDHGSGDLQSFALSPPGSAGFALKPPPRAADVKMKRQSLKDMGFDDGAFGEFA